MTTHHITVISQPPLTLTPSIPTHTTQSTNRSTRTPCLLSSPSTFPPSVILSSPWNRSGLKIRCRRSPMLSEGWVTGYLDGQALGATWKAVLQMPPKDRGYDLEMVKQVPAVVVYAFPAPLSLSLASHPLNLTLTSDTRSSVPCCPTRGYTSHTCGSRAEISRRCFR